MMPLKTKLRGLAVPLAGVIIVMFLERPGIGQTLTERSEFVQKLQQPYSALVEGNEFRIALRQVAQGESSSNAFVNLWIDRKVDPNLRVYPGALGSNRYASLTKIAASAQCVCYPIDDCVLVGRSEWVDRIVASLSKKRGRVTSSRIDVRWPDLTTPTEALQTTIPGEAALPHDLWAANEWKQIRATTAEALIRGQFASPERFESRFARSYRFADTQAIEASILESDPTVKFRRSGGAIVLTGSGSAHRMFVEACLVRKEIGSQATDAIATLKNDHRTFNLEVRNEQAGAVLKQLVGVAQIACEFDAAANPQLQKLVTFKVEDSTLWDIIQQVGRQAGLRFQSADGKLRVSPDSDRSR
ncbi:MAG: hypothetical protein AAFU85_01710 [Planctomycetota bacterium]